MSDGIWMRLEPEERELVELAMDVSGSIREKVAAALMSGMASAFSVSHTIAEDADSLAEAAATIERLLDQVLVISAAASPPADP